MAREQEPWRLVCILCCIVTTGSLFLALRRPGGASCYGSSYATGAVSSSSTARQFLAKASGSSPWSAGSGSASAGTSQQPVVGHPQVVVASSAAGVPGLPVPQGLYLGNGIVFCYAAPLGLSMWLEGADKGITPHLCRGLGWEPDVSAVFHRLVKQGDYVLDVGANVGYYTLMLAQLVGPSGVVKAIEASPRTYDLVSTSVEFNGLAGRVTVLNRAAFSRDDETVHISVSRDRVLNNHIVEGSTASNNVGPNGGVPAGMAPVRTLTIDSAVAGWPRVDLVKIDVEGAEVHAFKGMLRTLEVHKHRLVVLMEVNTDRMGSTEAARTFYTQIAEVFPRMLRISGANGALSPVGVDDLLAAHGTDIMLVLSHRPGLG